MHQSFVTTFRKASEQDGDIDFSLTVKAAPHECVIRTGQP